MLAKIRGGHPASSSSYASAGASSYMHHTGQREEQEANALINGEEPADEDEAEEKPEIWRTYECRSLDFGRPHPGSIVEGSALASIRLPPHTYPLTDSLAQQIADGSLSSMQLEGIMYACERHSRLLPDGHRRAGFFVGDSAGVGKGRQMAGIIVDNLVRGRPRHAWLSASKDLHLDATRDLRDIGCTIEVIDSIAGVEKATAHEGIVFSTYSGLVTKTKTKRFDQLIKWLCNGKSRAEYDGVVILDECHKAKNYFEGSKAKATTETGRHVVLLQDELPNARFVYSSATGISSVEGTGYLTRLGLWGPNTTFANFGDFANTFGNSKSGVSALEMLAMDFKATGFLVARNVGYAGAEFNVIQASITKEDAVTYRGAALLWRDVERSLRPMFHLCAAGVDDHMRPFIGKGKSHEGNYSQVVKLYWSAHQRFFKQMCMTLKIPQLVMEARAALKSGQCVVIGLQTTGEAAMGRAVDSALESQQQDEDEYDAFFHGDSDDSDDYGGGGGGGAGEDDDDDEPKKQRKKRKAPSNRANKRLELRESRGKLVSVCRSILDNFLRKHFPTKMLWQRAPDDPEVHEYIPPKWELVTTLALVARTVPGMDRRLFVRYTYDYLRQGDVLADMMDLPYYDEHGTIIEAQRERDRLLRRLDALDLPPAALDDLIDRLGGPTVVAEMTGRAHRQIRLEDGTVAIEPRTAKTTQNIELTMESLNVMEKNAFMSGQKLVAIISEAASTGISLHSDRSVANQRRRVHCTLELPWAADQAIQQLGRSHRTNQTSAPIYRLVSSGLGGESRFVSSVSRRLEALGALTQGDRRASMGAMSLGGEVNLEGKYGCDALKLMYEAIVWRCMPHGVDWQAVVKDSQAMMALDCRAVVADAAEPTWCPPPASIATEAQFFDQLAQCAHFAGSLEWVVRPPTASEIRERRKWLPHFRERYDALGERRLADATDGKRPHTSVPRFLNRLLGLPMAQQALMFNFFNHTMNSLIMVAKKSGKYDQGLSKIVGRSVTRVSPKEQLFRDPGTGGRMYLHHLQNDRGITLQEAVRELLYQAEVATNARARKDDFPVKEGAVTQGDYDAATALARTIGGGFFVTRKPVAGRRIFRLAWKTGQNNLFKVVGPATGLSLVTMKQSGDFERLYQSVASLQDLQTSWNAELELTKTQCMHGPNCIRVKTFGVCTVGLRLLPVYLVTGSIIPQWARLEKLLLSGADREAKVMRIVQADVPGEDGLKEHLVGLQWPPEKLKQLRDTLDALRTEHLLLKNMVIMAQYPVVNVPPKPTNVLTDYNARQATMNTYNTWLHDGAALDTMATLGFRMNAEYVVTEVLHTEPLSHAERLGVRVGMRLHRVGSYDPKRNPYSTLKHLVNSALMPPCILRELQFLKPDEEDDGRVVYGQAPQAPAPVTPGILKRLIKRPEALWAKADEAKAVRVQKAAKRNGRQSAASSHSSRKSPAVADDDDDDEPSLSKAARVVRSDDDDDDPIEEDDGGGGGGGAAADGNEFKIEVKRKPFVFKIKRKVEDDESDSDVQIVDAPKAQPSAKKPVERNLAGRPKRAAAAKVVFDKDLLASSGGDDDDDDAVAEEEASSSSSHESRASSAYNSENGAGAKQRKSTSSEKRKSAQSDDDDVVIVDDDDDAE